MQVMNKKLYTIWICPADHPPIFATATDTKRDYCPKCGLEMKLIKREDGLIPVDEMLQLIADER
jgi:hypothetical protein